MALGVAGAQEAPLPPVHAPGADLSGSVNSFPLLIPNVPLPTQVLPLPGQAVPPFSVGAAPVRLCTEDDALLQPVAPGGAAPDAVPCSVGAAFDSTSACSTAAGKASGAPVAGALLLGVAAEVDETLAERPAETFEVYRDAPLGTAASQCRGYVPGVSTVLSQDPNSISLGVDMIVPVCPYPALAMAPCTSVSIANTFSRSVNGTAQALDRDPCTFHDVDVDCGVVRAPSPDPLLGALGLPPSPVEGPGVDSGAVVDQARSALPNDGVVRVPEQSTDHSTPEVEEVVFPGVDAGGVTTCTTPGLPGPGTGQVGAVPTAHLWFNRSTSRSNLLDSTFNELAEKDTLVPRFMVRSFDTAFGSTPATSVGPVGMPEPLRAVFRDAPRTNDVYGQDLFGQVTPMEERTVRGLNEFVVASVHGAWPFQGPGGQPTDARCSLPQAPS